MIERVRPACLQSARLFRTQHSPSHWSCLKEPTLEARRAQQDENENTVARFTAHYPQPDMTPAEFEEFVVELPNSIEPAALDLTVTSHKSVQGMDGDYDIDAIVRYAFLGMDFLVLVEAKRHRHPIKRELVQVLHQKLASVGGRRH